MTGSRHPQERQTGTSAPRKPRALPFYYLPVSDSLRAWDFYVTGVGQRSYGAGSHYPDNDHPSLYSFEWRNGRILPEYAIILILAGSGEFEFRNQSLTDCTAGDALLVAPGEWHRYRPKSGTGWTELWLCAGGEYLHRLRRRGLAFTEHKTTLGVRFHGTRKVIHEILDSARQNTPANSPVLTAKAMHAIALIAEAAGRTATKEEADVADPVVADAIEFIWHNSHRPIHTADVAHAVGVQPRTLERRFAACHSRAVHDEIERSRYFRARRLLKESALPIKEVAYATGFGDPRRMIEVFRRVDAMTPSEVRSART